MNTCPVCNGTRKVTITINQIAVGRSVVSTMMEIGCVTCDQRGTMTDAELERHRRMQAAWCRCGADAEAIYVPDRDGVKHHWNCSACGGLVQTG